MEYVRYCLRLLCSIVFTVSLTQDLQAQNSSENDYGSWILLYGNTKIHEEWSVPVVGIVRHHHMLDKYGFFFFRTGATYKLSKASTITGGFALLNSNSYLGPDDVKNTNQLWLYAEYNLNTLYHTQKISHRFRVENRRLINVDDPKVNNRVRYRLQYVKPIYKDIYFKAFNELFLNIKGETFNQNRVFIGFGQQLNPKIKVDIGYFNRKFKKSNEDIIRLSLSFNIDLTKNDLALKTN